MEIKVTLTQILKSFVACYQHLDINMPPTCLWKWYYQPQNFTWNNKNQCIIHGWKTIFDINNNPNIEPMFCKYFNNLQNHDTPKGFCCLK